MSEEEKEAIEYLKTRLYGNEGCKYIDVAQEDLRIFINLIDRLQNLMEKLQKENKQLKKNNNKCLEKQYNEKYPYDKMKIYKRWI